MMNTTKHKVTYSRETWESLRADDYFREVIEVIEDREAMEKAKKETEYYVDYDEYKKKRAEKLNV